MVEKSGPWHKMISHISETWKKKKGFAYPFSGRDFKQLKNAARIFQESGVMALWDVFMESDSEWVRGTGYNINAFCGCLTWLVDDPYWKRKAEKYEKEFSAIPKEITDVTASIIKIEIAK